MIAGEPLGKNNTKMIHPRLLGVIRATINPLLPADATPVQVWEMIRPSNLPFLRDSFWAKVYFIQFARTPEAQVRIAEYIWRCKERAQKSGQPFPPKPIEVKPAFVPQPRIA